MGRLEQQEVGNVSLESVKVGDTVDVTWAGNPRVADQKDTRISGTATVKEITKGGEVLVEYEDGMGITSTIRRSD